MAEITVYTTHTRYCLRILTLLDARRLPYTVRTVASDEDFADLAERTGRLSCPLVFVGDALVGGVDETIAAERSGRLAALAAADR